MIISHKHKFIFIRTAKTAGTSIEIGLSKYCGPDDIMPPLGDGDEAIRAELCYPGPQNYQVPLSRYTAKDWGRRIIKGKVLEFYAHAPAEFVKTHVSSKVWREYFKFAFSRNPFDRAISLYFYHHKQEPRPSISEYVANELRPVRGLNILTVDGRLAVDRVYRFEDLDGAMRDLADRFGFPEAPELPKAKGGFRADKRHYREVLNESDRRRIESLFSDEFAAFGYEW